MPRKITIIVLLSLLSLQNFYAQEKKIIEPSKNAVHVSLGVFIVAYSGNITYDRLLVQVEKGFFKSYYVHGKFGSNVNLDFRGNDSESGLITSVGVTGLTGKRKNHFELSLGLGYFFNRRKDNFRIEDEDFSDDSTFYPNFSIGYRKQTAKGFMFRTGVGVTEWGYLGFGYSF